MSRLWPLLFRSSKPKHAGSNDLSLSSADVQSLMKTLPYDVDNPTIPFPSGVIGLDGAKYYHSEFLHQQLRFLLESKDEPFSIVALSGYLDISEPDARTLLDDRVVLSADQLNIFPPLHLARLTSELWERASVDFVPVDSFCADHDLPYSWILCHPDIGSEESDQKLMLRSWEKSKRHSRMYVFAPSLLRELGRDISSRLKQAVTMAEPVYLSPSFDHDSFLRLVQQIGSGFEGVVKQTSLSSGAVVFVPTSYLLAQAQSTLTDLESGATPYIDHKTFYANNRDLFPDVDSRKAYERKTVSLGGVSAVAGFWVSTLWLNQQIATLTATLLDRGFVDLGPAFADVDPVLRPTLVDTAISRLSRPPKPHKLAGCLVSRDLVQDLTGRVSMLAREQADEGWKDILSRPKPTAKRPVLVSSTIISLISSEYSLPKPLAEALYNKLSSPANDIYLEALDVHAVEQLQEFGQFWKDKVLLRWALYTTGIATLPVHPDSHRRLVAELEETLTVYMKRIISEALDEATLRMLLPRTTSAHADSVLRFKQAVEAADFVSLSDALAVFARDFDISTTFEDELIVSSKQAIMTKTFQSLNVLDQSVAGQMNDVQQNDYYRDACIILCALITLHSRLPGRERSLVYATGKSVARLEKSLRVAIEGPPQPKAKKGKKTKKPDDDSKTESELVMHEKLDLSAMTGLTDLTLPLIDRAILAIRNREMFECGDRDMLLAIIRGDDQRV